MKITQIETIRVREQRQNIWVHVHTDTGLVGLAACRRNGCKRG
jgi:hypothetical protein